MRFGTVIKHLEDNKYMARRAWPNITYIFLDGEIIKYSHLGIDSVWTPSHQDLLKSDWYEVIPER